MLSRTLTAFFTSSLLLLGTGCKNFYTTTTTSSSGINVKKTTTFNSSLPIALEQVFETCHEPLAFTPSTKELDLGGSCTVGTDLPTGNSMLVWSVLNAQDAVHVEHMIPANIVSALTDIYHVTKVFPWPAQNCEVYLDLDGMKVHGVKLQDMDVAWVKLASGAPALHIDFDGVPEHAFASGFIDGDVDCPSAINEPILQSQIPNGLYKILLNGIDLDIWFTFAWTPTTITATPHINFAIDEIELDPPLTPAVEKRVGSFEEMVEDYAGITKEEMEANVESALAPMMSDVAAQLAKFVRAPVPAGHKICGLSVVNNQLVLKTASVACPMVPPSP